MITRLLNRRTLCVWCLMVIFISQSRAQTYCGNMTIDGFKQENIDVMVASDKNGNVFLTMYRVKFARMMPVKVDLKVSPVVLHNSTLAGDSIVPVYKGKEYDKYIITALRGVADSKRLSVDCMMGDKHLHYDGRRKGVK